MLLTKKIMAITLCAMALLLGILVMSNEYSLFQQLANLSFDNRYSAGASVTVILYLIANVLLIVLPLINLIRSIYRRDPYGCIVSCAIIIVFRYFFVIFVDIIALAIMGVAAETWNAYLFGDSLRIIPILVFAIGLVFILISSGRGLAGTMARSIFICVGAGLTIFGLIFYYAREANLSGLAIFSLVVAIMCLGGLVVYSFLPKSAGE